MQFYTKSKSTDVWAFDNAFVANSKFLIPAHCELYVAITKKLSKPAYYDKKTVLNIPKQAVLISRVSRWTHEKLSIGST